ncbi:protein FAR1-RELATED SEQUENCE 5-like [Lactuca sativa]|uniref:protein FAR1-RELATED SEQUENCE 5-like n=1 Tax=Lactuca sativa TaxID=4236 RepID=UPI0022AF74E9|nr:protein FAR1-RELATED SEQUENCE 5-like [Lactuca sativa]
MDATYKTNKYNLPFLEIVGVTSTNKTFSIAFAFMHNEKTSNYIWPLTCLKLTINDSFCPRVIVTDRDLALMKACGDVFPQSNHLLCRWHIFNDITKHCRQRIKPQKTWNSFHLKWTKLVESPTLNAYMQNYADLQTLLFEHADVFDYLYTVWLGKYAERFVSLWTDKHVSFGNSTTNRVESQHAKLKKHLESGKCDLDKFIRVIEKVVQSQETTIKETFTRCIITYMPRFKDQIFEVLRKRVSVHAMDKILEELHRSKRFVPTPENCGCQLRTCFGLPCAHEFVMYVGTGSPIPLDSVDAFWRKLDLTPSISVEYGDLNVDHRMQRFKEIYNIQPDHIKYNYLRRMEEITDPSTNLINEPSVKKNNRGRPKIKRVKHQSQAPHRYSC